jgi:DNA-binding NarL/FixJ family response regulator
MHSHATLIIEDRKHIAVLLQKAVAATPGLKYAGTAATLLQGLRLLSEQRPRIVLVDLGLPDGSGLEVIRAAARADWQIDAMVISIFGDERRVIEAIRAGARGYILKGSDLQQIGADIMAMIDGGSPISPSIARHVLNQLGGDNMGEAPAGLSVLSPREAEILRAVARGYKRHEISAQLSISEGTVGNHITRIYRKLKVGSNIEAVSRATKDGLI